MDNKQYLKLLKVVLEPTPPMEIVQLQKDEYEPCEYCLNASGLIAEKGGCISCGASMKKKVHPDNQSFNPAIGGVPPKPKHSSRTWNPGVSIK